MFFKFGCDISHSSTVKAISLQVFDSELYSSVFGIMCEDNLDSVCVCICVSCDSLSL